MNIFDINFTKYNNQGFNNEIAKQLSHVLSVILKFKDQLGLVSVVLSGGFGRGEGSVVYRDNKVTPLNDYDITLVVDKHLLMFQTIPDPSVFRTLRKVCTEIKERYSIDCLDFEIIPYKRILAPQKTIKNYEIKYGAKVIWGLDVIKQMPECRPEQIPLSEGAILLFNRMICPIKGFLPESSEEIKYSILQSNKALQACCESLLLIAGSYHYSYEERNKRFKIAYQQNFPDLQKDLPWLIDYVDNAIKFKLCPDFGIFQDYRKLWNEVVDIYFRVFIYYMATCYRCRSGELDSIIKTFFRENKTHITDNLIHWGGYLLNMWAHDFKIMKFNLAYKPKIFLHAAEPYVLYMLRYGVNDDYLEMARSYLRNVIGVSRSEDLLSLRKKAIAVFGYGASK